MKQKSFGVHYPYHWFRWYDENVTIKCLDDYLNDVYESAQEWHKQFAEYGYSGASACKLFENSCGMIEMESELPKMALESMDLSVGTEHTKVQKHLMDKDIFSVAVEVPVFLNDWCMYGHIDLIRYKDDRIEIWDYKNHINGNVKSQLYCYMLMLAIRLQLPFNRFDVGYFTKYSAYKMVF